MSAAKTFEAIESQLEPALGINGLSVHGWFIMFDGPAELNDKPAALIGNHGGGMWQAFCNSPLHDDDQSDPLDRWTLSIIDPMAAEIGATALYPFIDNTDYDVHWPFQRWAKTATSMRQSPPGLLINAEFGLWQAFRAVMVFDQAFKVHEPAIVDHSCDDCDGRPCLTACPVSAIDQAGYNVSACRQHVQSFAGVPCRERGCLARNACPVGPEQAYGVQQQAFHMAAFLHL